MSEDRALDGRRLRLNLRGHRETLSLSQSEVAAKLGWSTSKVHRIEKGTSPIADDDLQRLLALYGVSGIDEVERLRTMAGASRRPQPSSEFRDILPASARQYMDFERAARRIWNFESTFVPGLLQTPGYTRALLSRVSVNNRDPEVIERAVAARAHRQRILDDANPVQLDVLIDEAVILRNVGGPKVMRGQLEHLWAMSERPNISLDIVPFTEGAYPGMRTPFAVLRFRDPSEGDLLFVEDPVHEVTTRGSGQDARSNPRTYLAAFEEISSLTGDPGTTALRLRKMLRELTPDES